MPQLDKYIFFNQVIALIVIFFLIYFYIRERGMFEIGIPMMSKYERVHVIDRANFFIHHTQPNSHEWWDDSGDESLDDINNFTAIFFLNYYTLIKIKSRKLINQIWKNIEEPYYTVYIMLYGHRPPVRQYAREYSRVN